MFAVIRKGWNLEVNHVPQRLAAKQAHCALPAFAPGEKLCPGNFTIRNSKTIEKSVNRIHIMHE